MTKTGFNRLKSEYSDALEAVDLNILQHYITTGKSSGLPNDVVIYLELLEMVRSMYSKYETKNFIINTLMAPVYELSRKLATQLYFDALNFFYSDNSVKQKAWENIYADHMEKLAYYAIERDEIENARRCFMDAAKLRGVGREERSEIPQEMLNRPVIIYTLDPEKVGLPMASRKELAEFIDNIPEISERERVRVKRDAGVIETTLFEEIVNEDKENQGQ